MRVLITGSPGTGKTTLAKQLSEKTGWPVINEMDFAIEKRIGQWDHESNELVLPLDKMKKELTGEIKAKENIILEGHTICEIALPVEAVIVLRVHPEALQERLSAKGYSSVKIADNVFCEGIDYCKKHVERNYKKKKIIEEKNQQGIKETACRIMKKLEAIK